MDKKQTTATCPKCGEEIVQCENCENMGCPDCDGFVVTRGDVILCPECAAACKEDCDKMRAVGCGSCALFADEDDEGQGWCELHQESVCFIDKCKRPNFESLIADKILPKSVYYLHSFYISLCW